MLKYEKITFLARKVAPKPEEVSFWIDLSADPYGRVWKYWDGDNWQPLSMGGSGGAVDAYSKAEADQRFATAATLQQVADDVTEKQDTLVSGVNIRTINSQSVLGSGDIKIDVGLTQSQVESIVNNKVSGLVDSAPTTLDTLKEIATALNNDPAFATTITTLIGQKVNTIDYESDKANFATKSELANKADAADLDDYITTEAADAKYALKGEGGDVDLSDYLTTDDAASTYATKTELSTKADETDLQSKQDTLVSGTNIKTINSQSILGTGNIEITTGTGGITDAPSDSKLYGRQNGLWAEVPTVDTSNFATQSALTSGLASKVDTATYTDDKATFALKSEIPDTSDFITTETADGKYQPKGTYLTEVPAEYITETELTDKGYATTTQLSSKQDTLVSGTNIKTINSQSLLGEGNIDITSGTGGIPDAPSDSKLYGRKNAAWTEVTTPDLSSYATQEYVNTQVSNLVNSAPDALNTLDELAAALGDDANFATTVTNSLASKAALSGAEFTGTIGAPIVAFNRTSEGMMGAIQAESNDILFRTYNAGVSSMTFQVQSSTPLKITEAGIWENNQLLENKYAQLSDLDDLATTAQLNNKQDTLVSGTNIKTVNGQSLLGEGDVTITGGGDIDLGDYVTSDSLSTTLSGYVQTSAIADMETKTNAAATYQPKGDYATTSSLTSKLDTSTYNSDKATFALKTELPDISTKQDTLVSGTNIKTINGETVLGSGNITISSTLSSSYAAGTATAPVANDTYEQAIAKLHAYINQLESITGILNREDVAQESSLSNLPNNKNYILASVSSNQTLSFTTSGWADNTSVHIFVYNSSSSEITITIPNTGGYVNMSSETLTIPGNTGAEIDAFKDERGNIWIRHAAGELTIDPDLAEDGGQQLG